MRLAGARKYAVRRRAISLASRQSIVTNDVSVRLDTESEALGNSDGAILRNDGVAIQLRFQIEVAPLHQRIGAAERSAGVDAGEQAGTVVEGMHHDTGVVRMREGEDFAQFGDATHLRRARLHEVDSTGS